jgi:hypothetical protein
MSNFLENRSARNITGIFVCLALLVSGFFASIISGGLGIFLLLLAGASLGFLAYKRDGLVIGLILAIIMAIASIIMTFIAVYYLVDFMTEDILLLFMLIAFLSENLAFLFIIVPIILVVCIASGASFFGLVAIGTLINNLLMKHLQNKVKKEEEISAAEKYGVELESFKQLLYFLRSRNKHYLPELAIATQLPEGTIKIIAQEYLGMKISRNELFIDIPEPISSNIPTIENGEFDVKKFLREITGGIFYCPSCGSMNDFSTNKELLNHFCEKCDRRLNDYWERFHQNKLTIQECQGCNEFTFSNCGHCINCGCTM